MMSIDAFATFFVIGIGGAATENALLALLNADHVLLLVQHVVSRVIACVKIRSFWYKKNLRCAGSILFGIISVVGGRII